MFINIYCCKGPFKFVALVKGSLAGSWPYCQFYLAIVYLILAF